MSDYPTSASDGWSNGNPNVSYYPCKVIVDDDAEFRSGDYVSVKYSNTGQEDTESYYLESMFVRSDAGGRYVYVQDKDGLLKRRNIQTGKSPDSYVVEVKSGLSEDDYIAFPYGSNVEEGAQTEQVSIDELYSY
jgi:multidrug efflux pump subunit AcrA (membrane-fusion protein)